MHLRNVIIYLIGIPAVGKNTIVKTLTVPHPNALTLDTSQSTPQAVAKRIIEHVNQLKRE
jgi:GTPase Era involved in 16S rRNA processing